VPADDLADAVRPARWRALIVHSATVVVLLVGVFHYYDSTNGFTALIGFGGKQAASVVPALRDLPHQVMPAGSAGYDGQFYAQMAVDPLLKDPLTDSAMDDAPLRARRILLSWTAYLIGLGRPAWILQVFALQNVLAWIALTFVLRRWFALTTARGLALWLGTLFSAGLLWSVRFALLDGPSLLLISLAVASIESGRRWLAASICGIAGLARETNVLTLVGLIDPAEWKSRRSIVRQVGLVALALIPLAIWFDYIHAIYRSRIFTSGETLARPFAGAVWRTHLALEQFGGGAYRPAAMTFALVAAFVTQIGFLVARPRWKEPWWRIGVAYAALLPLLGQPLWTGTLPTVIRVELPLLVAFNVGLRDVERHDTFWLLLACGNLSLLLQPLFG
jgi:hypothetical protein